MRRQKPRRKHKTRYGWHLLQQKIPPPLFNFLFYQLLPLELFPCIQIMIKSSRGVMARIYISAYNHELKLSRTKGFLSILVYQFTCIKGLKSNKREMTCGVPQGSILRPLLFILLINDLPNASSFFTLIFADDTLLQFFWTDLHTLYNLANSELNKISDWFKANQLTLNESKTKYILFRNKST